MAKIKLGAIVVDMSGKLGGHVFAKNKGGNYMRTKTTPTNPQTLAQTLVRLMFATISSLWSTLSEANRISFHNKVAEYSRTNVFGDLKNPSAKALFQRLNQNLALTGQAQVTECPSPAKVVAPLITLSEGVVGTQTLDFTVDALSTGSKILVSATPPMSQGTRFIKNKLRNIEVITGSVAQTYNISSSYIARFGALIEGQNIYVSVVYVNAQGQASPPQSIKATVYA